MNIQHQLNVWVPYAQAKPGMKSRAGGWTLAGVWPTTTANGEAARLAHQGNEVSVQGNYESPKQVWYRPDPNGPGGGQGPGGGGGTPTGGTAPGAVQQGLPGITGGGPRFAIGAGQIRDFLPDRAEAFDGIDTFTPPEKLPSVRSPMAVNWDDFERYGSFCVRRGSAKLNEDRETLDVDYFNIVCIAKASFTASTDYITFTLPDSTTHAFWFDTTGSDSEPAGSSSATNSTQVDISGDTTAADVASTLASAINTAAIGLAATSESTACRAYPDDQINDVISVNWTLAETVTDGGFTVTPITPTSMDEDYRGISIARIPGNSDQPDLLLYCFADVEPGNTPSVHPTVLCVVKPYPAWGRPDTLIDFPGPKLSLSQQAGPELRVTADYTNVYDATNQLGKQKQSVTGIIIRYSTTNYPVDMDGEDYLKEDGGTVSTALADRTSWDGTSTNYDTAVGPLPTGTYYVTAWAFSRMGYSKPSHARLEIT